MIHPLLHRMVAAQPHPLVFATLSGAHLYGFASPDSDYDLRACHVLPLTEIVRLDPKDLTLEDSRVVEGLEMDIVSHDVRKFFAMVLKKNGYVLEQIFSPWIVHTSPEHAELKDIARRCITRHHSHHYLGFAETQWNLFEKESPRRVKPLLYTYRVLLTGIHLMRTGEVEGNLVTLNQEARLPGVEDLVQQKRQGTEKEGLSSDDISAHRAQYERLVAQLETASAESSLPEAPQARAELDDLLVRVRLKLTS